MKSPEQGAATLVWLATHREGLAPQATYYIDQAPVGWAARRSTSVTGHCSYSSAGPDSATARKPSREQACAYRTRNCLLPQLIAVTDDGVVRTDGYVPKN